MRIIGIDPASADGDHAVITEVSKTADGKVRVHKITQLYGKPGNIIFPGKTVVELRKDKDGVYR